MKQALRAGSIEAIRHACTRTSWHAMQCQQTSFWTDLLHRLPRVSLVVAGIYLLVALGVWAGVAPARPALLPQALAWAATVSPGFLADVVIVEGDVLGFDGA